MQTDSQLEIENLRKIIKPSRLRLAVLRTEETYDGIIILPQNKNQTHKLGTVLAAGSDVDVGVALDDIIMYQVNAMFEAGVTHMINDTPVLFMHKGDAIGKVTSRTVSIDTFQILGDYLLLEEIRLEQIGGLFLPDSAIPPPEFRIVQLGATVTEDEDPMVQSLEVGDIVYVDRTRTTTVRLGMKNYYYLPKGWLHGKQEA